MNNTATDTATISKIMEMVTLQEAMNTKVNPDWRNAGYQWHRAIWTECAELLEHIGWKWWKSETTNLEQCQLEIVDIWHFCISAYLQDLHTGTDFNEFCVEVADSFDSAERFFDRPETDIRFLIESFVRGVIETKEPNLHQFKLMMILLDMSFDDLYKQYIAKNILNMFRQDNGYQSGDYQKTWFGMEDNEYLSDIIKRTNSDNGDYANSIRATLESTYKQVTKEPLKV